MSKPSLFFLGLLLDPMSWSLQDLSDRTKHGHRTKTLCWRLLPVTGGHPCCVCWQSGPYPGHIHLPCESPAGYACFPLLWKILISHFNLDHLKSHLLLATLYLSLQKSWASVSPLFFLSSSETLLQPSPFSKRSCWDRLRFVSLALLDSAWHWCCCRLPFHCWSTAVLLILSENHCFPPAFAW